MPALSENQRIDLVIAELTALKAANDAGAALEQCRRQYWAAKAVSHLFQEDDMAAVADSAATELERAFRWDVETDRPARDDEPLSTAQVERVFPRRAA